MFTPPARKSMSDLELQNALGSAHADEAGILSAMELLETQSSLREEDDRAFVEWSRALIELGTPEALHALENGRRQIAGLEPIEFSSHEAQSAHDSKEQTEIAFVSSDEQATTVQAQASPTQPQATDFAAALNALYAPSVTNELDEQPEPEAESEGADPQTEVLVEQEAELETSEPEVVEPETPQLVLPLITPAPSSPEAVSTLQKPIALINSWLSINSVGFLALFSFGVYLLANDVMSGLLGIVLGTFCANLPIAAAIIAAKRSARPSLVVSRAAFGVFGNQIPAWLSIVSRFAATASAFAILFHMVFQTTQSQNSDFALSPSQIATLVAIMAIGIALAVLKRLQSVVFKWASIASLALSLVLAVGFAPLFSFANIDFQASNNSNLLQIAGLVFSVYVAVWLSSAGDWAAEIGKSTRAINALAWSSLATFAIPTVVIVFFFLALSGFSSALSVAVKSSLFVGISQQSPLAFWALAIAVFLSAILWLSHASLSIQGMLAAVTKGVSRVFSTAALAFLLSMSALMLNLSFSASSFAASTLDIFRLASIPAVAWAGIFTTDVLLRRVAYHEVSLDRSYGFYKPFNFLNLAGWAIAMALGFGFFSPIAENSSLVNWAGFLNNWLPDLSALIGETGFLIFAVFTSAAVFPLIGIARIKFQEREALALESRRDDLKDIFKFGE